MVGCGIWLDKREIFFTKNGAFCGVAFKNVEIPPEGFFPAVTIQSMSHHIEANFGTKKFVFDMEGYRQRESLENFFDICATPFDRAKLHSLVKSYLVHYSYVETLQAYEDGTHGKKKAETEGKLDLKKKEPEFAVPSLSLKASNGFPGLTQTNFAGQPRDRKMTIDR